MHHRLAWRMPKKRGCQSTSRVLYLSVSMHDTSTVRPWPIGGKVRCGSFAREIIINSQLLRLSGNRRRSLFTIYHLHSSEMRQVHYYFAITIAVVTIAILSTLPSASSLLISPFLLNFITGHHHHAFVSYSRVLHTIIPPKRRISYADSSNSPPALVNIDFAHDDDLMKCKHELLLHIYQQSLSRGFVGREGT